MPIRAIERNFWQFSVLFDPVNTWQPSPAGVVHLFQNLPAVFPGATWEFPALTNSNAIRISPGSTGPTIESPLALGVSLDGWHVEVVPSSLTLRCQQEVVGYTTGNREGKKTGERALSQDELPTRKQFLVVVEKVLAALPVEARSKIHRVSMTAEYVGFAEGHPGAWIAARFGGAEAPAILPDRVRAIRHHAEHEFEELLGRRHVWIDQLRMGNWFSPDGFLLRDAAVVFTAELKTALPEVPGAPWEPALGPSEPLSADEIAAFASDGESGALSRAIARVRKDFPRETTVHE